MTVSEFVMRLLFVCSVIRKDRCYRDSLEWVGVGVATISSGEHTLLGVQLELPCVGPLWREQKPVATVS